LKLTIIADLKATNFLSIESNVDTLDLLHELNCHFLVTETAFLLVAWHLDETQMSVDALIVDIYSSFDVRFNLHFNLKDIVLLEDLLVSSNFNSLFLLWRNSHVNLELTIWVMISHFRHLLFIGGILFLLVEILFLTLLKHMDHLTLM